MCAHVLEFTKAQTRKTLDEAVEVFLRDRKGTVRGIASDTDRTYRERLGRFTDWAAERGLQHIDEVDADTIDAFFVHLRDERKNPADRRALSDNTIRDYFLSMRAFFSALHRRGTISYSPIAHKAAKDFPEPEIDRFTPSDEEMRKVLALFDGDGLYADSDFGERKTAFLRTRNRAVLSLMVECGLRSYEIRNLEITGLDWDYGRVTFTAKGAPEGQGNEASGQHAVRAHD